MFDKIGLNNKQAKQRQESTTVTPNFLDLFHQFKSISNPAF